MRSVPLCPLGRGKAGTLRIPSLKRQSGDASHTSAGLPDNPKKKDCSTLFIHDRREEGAIKNQVKLFLWSHHSAGCHLDARDGGRRAALFVYLQERLVQDTSNIQSVWSLDHS